MTGIDAIRKLRNTDTIIIMGFTLLSLLLLFNHEPWRDEAQAWLLARDSISIRALLGQMGYEGTPALCHLILYLPAQLGLPYRAMFIIHFLIILTAIITFMRHAPLLQNAKDIVCLRILRLIRIQHHSQKLRLFRQIPL